MFSASRVPGPGSVADTVERLTTILAARGVKLFAVIAHAGAAREAGRELRETKVVVFGAPKAGTPVMQAAPLAALDLPLRVLVWDAAGQAKVSCTAPAGLPARYRMVRSSPGPRRDRRPDRRGYRSLGMSWI